MHRITHITEAFGGGVTSALASYLDAAPAFEHTLILAERAKYDLQLDLSNRLAKISRTRPGPLGLATQLRTALAEHRPDIVHLHSSWAGAVYRSMNPPRGVPVIYTPHCFYFERTDISALTRKLAYGVERRLAARTTLALGVSPREQSLAQSLGMRSLFLPNAVDPGMGIERVPTRGRVVAVGRLTAQKDPGFFAQVAVEVRRSGGLPDVEFVWVGDGERALRRRLERSGVTVTGWISREDVLNQLATAQVYVHTAAWEGNPMTLLEAQSLDLPVISRSIPSVVSLGFEDGLRTPADVARRVADELRTPGPIAALRASRENSARQAEVLNSAYLSVLGRPSAPPGDEPAITATMPLLSETVAPTSS